MNTKKRDMEVIGKGTDISLGPDDFAVVVKSDSVKVYVPGDVGSDEDGLGLGTAAGMATAANLLTGLLMAMLTDAAAMEDEEEDN